MELKTAIHSTKAIFKRLVPSPGHNPDAPPGGPATQLVQTGRHSPDGLVYVNPPLVRGTTVLAPTLGAWRERAGLATRDKPRAAYGRFGTPTTSAFETAIAELDGAYRALCFPSGLAACAHALLAVCAPGGHVLVSEFAYWPLREFAETTLRQLGVDVEFFTEGNAEGVARRFRPNTQALFLEAPASISFEVAAVDEIAARARAQRIWVVMDNTWATPLLFRPLDHGADIAVQSASKYIGGHSDCILGVASCNEAAWGRLAESAVRFGQTASPDDLYQALRGLRTLPLRLQQHGCSALALAAWLEQQPEVAVVRAPGLPSHPDHATFTRLFAGSSGLFSFVLRPCSEEQLGAFFDSLRLFGIGLSWGGYESLVVPLAARPSSAVGAPAQRGQLVRVHAGLEDVGDLIGDLQAGLAAMRACAAEGPTIAVDRDDRTCAWHL